MKVINLCGGPGIGKSTVAALLFSKMKLAGHNVELITEYAKELVWDKRGSVLKDQLYILAKQNRKLQRLAQDVEYVVTDSPLFLCAHYNAEFTTPEFKKLVIQTYNQYDNHAFCLPRPPESTYSELGREQTFNEAKDVDWALVCLMVESKLAFQSIYVPTTVKLQDTAEEITTIIYDKVVVK